MYWPISQSWLFMGLLALLLNGCAQNPTNESANGTYPEYQDPAYSEGANYNYSSSSAGNSGYYTVQPGDTLYGIARRHGLNYLELANWNSISPPYTIHIGQSIAIPGYSAASTQSYSSPANISALSVPSYSPIPRSGSETSHVVRQGETLYSIARQYGQNYRDIAAWNNIPPPYSLSTGQRLITSPPQSYAAPSYSAQSASYSSLPSNSGRASGYHVVAAGDTLYNISRRYGLTVSQLAGLNSLRQPYRSLRIGEQLAVGGSKGNSLSSLSHSRSQVGYHTVSHGDTLYNIAKRYGQAVKEVAKWNNLSPPYTISIGQRLKVSPSYQGSELESDKTSPQPFKALAQKSSKPKILAQAKPQPYYQPAANTPVTEAENTSEGSPIPQESEAPATQPEKEQTATHYHVVQQGENLAGIADKHGLTTHDLSIWNGIGKPYTVFPGQRLLIVTQ